MEKFIDAHLHLGGIPSKDKEWGSFAEYQEIAEKVGVGKFCLVPIGLPANFTNKSTPDNNSVLEEAEKNNKVIPIYWFNVFDLPEEIDKRYKAIKFHPDIGQVNIDDQRVIDFVNKIGLPVFVHTNENKDYSNLARISNLAKKVKIPVIAVHSGSVTKTFFKLDDYEFTDNVYFEISGIQYAVILKKIYKKFGAEKIIFGSDYPFGDPRVSLAMLDSLDASKKDYNLIVKENILGILR
ncbi:MAG: amidohydrolase family protein [Nanoarchaeota archaeon]|nr:amidohydrolase family protein [Nanoarchaeota archaeon]